jgi:hypothetical protein
MRHHPRALFAFGGNDRSLGRRLVPFDRGQRFGKRMPENLVENMDEVVSVALDGTIVPLAAKEKLPEPVKVIAEPPITH